VRLKVPYEVKSCLWAEQVMFSDVICCVGCFEFAYQWNGD